VIIQGRFIGAAPYVAVHLRSTHFQLQRLPPDEVARILRVPSVLGRDLINQFRFTCDYQAGIVELSRP
jgi:hypothetical protein